MVGAGRRALPVQHDHRLGRDGLARAGRLEDGLFIGKGRLAESNAEQVAKIVRILRELSLEVATPDEAREILGLKGLDQVGW